MAEIIVEISPIEAEEIAGLSEMLENRILSEEEYAERLWRILGSRLPEQPQDGDTLRLVVRPRLVVSYPRAPSPGSAGKGGSSSGS